MNQKETASTYAKSGTYLFDGVSCLVRPRSAELLDKIAEWNPQRKRPVNRRKDGIRDRMQRRNIRDEECFDGEIWRKKKDANEAG
jgi:hypothetical protein